MHLFTWLKYLQSQKQIQNGVKGIYGKLLAFPAVYDKGTHYVTNMRLTLEILKTLQDFDFVVEVTGDYTGTLTGRGASHEHRGHTG